MDIIVVLGVVSVLLVVCIPRLDQISRRARLDQAAHEVASVLRSARQEARMRGHNVGLKFYPKPGQRPTFALYRDGDGDGVRTADIRFGRDPALGIERPLEIGADIRFGIPLDERGYPPRRPFSRRRLDRVDDPIRFNRSDIASFSAAGTATPGTLYLTDGQHAMAVRVRNRVGKIEILRYDRRLEIWH